MENGGERTSVDYKFNKDGENIEKNVPAGQSLTLLQFLWPVINA